MTFTRFSFCLVVLFCLASALGLSARALQAAPADSNPVSGFCVLFGTTTPFDAATLSQLYPTHATYVRQFTRATESLVRQGFLLPADAEDALFTAQQAPVPDPAG